MVTIISDAKYMIILDEILVAGVICASVVYFLDSGMVEVAYRFLYGLVLFSIMLLIKVFGDTAFKQESLGWGDIKLSFFVGLVLGIKMGIMYIFLGAFLALPYAIFQTIKKKSNILPFGPFLVLAFILLFWNYEFVSSTISMLYGGII
jgi:prepilin signal peptidase PulO-like enzyme (type II secretory pathway)